jgi:tetratricopeptide (TPR) repeat protein
MESDNLEQPDAKNTDAGSFFNKYKPRQLPEPEAGNKFFRKFVLAQDEHTGESDEQSGPDRPGLAADSEYSAQGDYQHTTKPVPAFIRLKLLSVLTGIAILVGILYANNRHSLLSDESVTPPVETAAAQPAGGQSGESLSSVLPNSTATPVRRGKIKTAQPEEPKDPSFRSLSETGLLARAQTLEERGFLNEAAKVYQNILNEFPYERYSRTALDRIQGAFSARQKEERVRAARESGLMKFRNGDYPGAEADLAVAVNAGRSDTATLYALGMSHLRLGNHSKALASLNDCIDDNPDYAPALVGLAQLKLIAGDKPEALSLLDRALQLGGGAEFTPVKIRDMISSLDPKAPAPPKRTRGYFFAYAVHRHAFPLVWCRGELRMNDSVVEFKSEKPSHSFRVPTIEVVKAGQPDDEIVLSVNGTHYRFTLKGKTARDFLSALNP